MKSRLSAFLKLLEGFALALAVFCLVHPVCAHSEPAAYYEGQVEPRSGENFGFAQYCCWLPTVPSATKGVLCVVLHPHGNTGVKFENPKPWIELAGCYQCALLSLSFVEAADKTRNWSYAFEGSGRALIAALDEAAAASGVAELARSRVVIAGICEAGQFAYGFSTYAPGRASAFMTMGGSLHQVPLAWEAADVPGLLVAATDRGQSAFDNMFSLFAEGQKFFAPWEFSLERIKDYDQGHSSALVEGFLNTALARLQGSPPSTSSTGSTTISRTAAGTLFRETQPDARFAEAGSFCFGDSADDWLHPWETAMAECLTDLDSSSSTLSFVSVPVPALGHVGTERVDLGAIHLAAGVPEHIIAAFPVYANEGSAVEGVAVASGQDGFSWQAVRLNAGEWQLRCNLDLSFLPTGAFTVPVPVRFLSGNKVEPGGLTTIVSGRIFRDVSSEPSVINFGRIDALGQHACLKLRSASGTPIKVLSIESSLPGETKAKIAATADSSVEVDCSISPAVNLSGAFSGYYLLRVKSDREQTLRIIFFGENTERGR